MRRSRRVLFWLSVLVSLTASAVEAQAVVNACGQAVNGAGVLGGDLNCSGESVNAAVFLSGTLQLGGFTLTAPTGGDAVRCGEKCRVQGPGTVRGHVGSFGGAVKLSELSISAFGPYDIAIRDPTKLKLLDVTVNGYDSGIAGGPKVKVIDSQLTGTGFGGGGIFAERITLIRSSVTGFGRDGIVALLYPRLVDSNVTGNGIDPVCIDTFTCVDIVSLTSMPRLRGSSTCGTSGGNAGTSWGICTSD